MGIAVVVARTFREIAGPCGFNPTDRDRSCTKESYPQPAQERSPSGDPGRPDIVSAKTRVRVSIRVVIVFSHVLPHQQVASDPVPSVTCRLY